MNEWVELHLHDIRVLFISPGATNSQVQKKKKSENQVELELPKLVQENIGW